MDKAKIVRQLQSIINQMNLSMKESEFDQHINFNNNEFEMKFDNFLWGEEKSKVTTVIKMTKKEVE